RSIAPLLARARKAFHSDGAKESTGPVGSFESRRPIARSGHRRAATSTQVPPCSPLRLLLRQSAATSTQSPPCSLLRKLLRQTGRDRSGAVMFLTVATRSLPGNLFPTAR